MVNQENIHQGIVKIYYPLKGYGFITRETGKDVFFLRTAVKEESWTLEGTPVKFSIVKINNRVQATEIQRIG